MFGTLKEKIRNALRTLSGNNRITEGNIAEVVRDIRRTLRQSDVEYNIAKEITDEIKKEALVLMYFLL